MIIKSLIESCGVLTLADKIHSEMFFFCYSDKKGKSLFMLHCLGYKSENKKY